LIKLTIYFYLINHLSMHKLIRSKLPLLLTAFLFAGSFPASVSAVCLAKNYTIASRDNDGRSGADGRNETIIANGSAASIDLSGAAGQDGRDGANGSNSYCSRTADDVDYDVRAQDGARGDDGGKGGNGGNGGSLTAYYTNIEDLKKILVRALGGNGGRGGRGGSGAPGCRCTTSSWQKTKCKGTDCTTKTYRCSDGNYGSNGSNGGDGQQGNLGTLNLVKGKDLLPQEIPTTRLSLTDLAAKPLKLTKNKWNLRSGATALLASGSVISDEYREFERQLEANIKLDWQEKLPISHFADQTATLVLNDDNQVNIDFSDDLWVDSSSKTEANATVLTVNNIIPQKDVTRLQVGELANSGSDMNLILVDLGGRADILKNQFRLKLRLKTNEDSGSFDLRKLYEGEIPANLVKRESNRLFLALGKLPIRTSELRPGSEIEVELQATRSLGIRSAKQKIRWSGTIRRPR
jgi:hypothetical protein